MENNEADVDGVVKNDRKDKSKFKSSSYKCQFCEKSFPRLGYLKKHEQVSGLIKYILLPIFHCSHISITNIVSYKATDINLSLFYLLLLWRTVYEKKTTFELKK